MANFLLNGKWITTNNFLHKPQGGYKIQNYKSSAKLE